jgi:plastocyanin
VPRLSRWIAAALVLAAAAAAPRPVSPLPSPAASAHLTGRVELKEKGGRLVPGEGTLVMVDGPALGEAAPAPVVVSKDKRFTPRVIAVRKGAQVTFPNVDPIFHNAFSRTPGNEFDLGLYRRGASRSVRLNNPGLVRVYCNIHPEMAAYVMVVERGPFATAGADGQFSVRGIAPGPRTVRFWNERGGQQEQVVVFRPGAGQRLDVVLDASAYRWLPHKNKHGADYPPARPDGERY